MNPTNFPKHACLYSWLHINCSFLLQVCVSPSYRDVNETLCSLKFGLRAMKVHNVAQVNVEVSPKCVIIWESGKF